MKVSLLVSPLTKGAYFADSLGVARAELEAHFPGVSITPDTRGGLDFLDCSLEQDQLRLASRLSFCQGIFHDQPAGLIPLEQDPDFELAEDFVYGAKYRGKTNELVTQLAINLGLLSCKRTGDALTLLDPMAGRGTTLLWALRYGMDAKGIELSSDALNHLHQHVKKQTKLHRIKHSHSAGSVGGRAPKGEGRFVEYTIGQSRMRLIHGDSQNAPELLSNQRFDLLVADLPYGVQHRGGKGKPRSIRQVVVDCAPAWKKSVRSGGALVLIFNQYASSRDSLAKRFREVGCRVHSFSAPHRMSESIVRDLLVLTAT